MATQKYLERPTEPDTMPYLASGWLIDHTNLQKWAKQILERNTFNPNIEESAAVIYHHLSAHAGLELANYGDQNEGRYFLVVTNMEKFDGCVGMDASPVLQRTPGDKAITLARSLGNDCEFL